MCAAEKINVQDDALVATFVDCLERSMMQQQQRSRAPLKQRELGVNTFSLFENHKAEARATHDTRKGTIVDLVERRVDRKRSTDVFAGRNAPIAIPGVFGVERQATGAISPQKRVKPSSSSAGGAASFAVVDEIVRAENADYDDWESLDDIDLANKFIMHNRWFRHDQKKICDLALKKHDVFVLMPTGGGKSLCYQLPAAMAPGLAIVISPLISLIVDQVKALVDKDYPATYLSSSQTERERKNVYRELHKALPSCKLLYLTPEQFVKSQALQSVLKKLHGNGLLSRLVVDEAHCISQWGHDFRVDYKKIGTVKRNLFPGLPSMALTATATEGVRADVMKTLHMDKNRTKFFKVSFNRPNIFWRILPKVYEKDKEGRQQYLTWMANYIKTKWMNETGIIYCLTRDECEDTAAQLREEFGLRAYHYHAGMTPKQRNLVQISWKDGRTPIICATVAFGMGVDNAHVRFVIHQTMPKSVEGYYQESGRAGRGGEPAEAVLLYNPKDVRRVKSLIASGKIKKKQRETQMALCEKMRDYSEEGAKCRREMILAYFGETFLRARCNGTCDNCARRHRPS